MLGREEVGGKICLILGCSLHASRDYIPVEEHERIINGLHFFVWKHTSRPNQCIVGIYKTHFYLHVSTRTKEIAKN